MVRAPQTNTHDCGILGIRKLPNESKQQLYPKMVLGTPTSLPTLLQLWVHLSFYRTSIWFRSNGRFGAGGRVPLEPQPGREVWMTGRGESKVGSNVASRGLHVAVVLKVHPVKHSASASFRCSDFRRWPTVLLWQLLGVQRCLGLQGSSLFLPFFCKECLMMFVFLK